MNRFLFLILVIFWGSCTPPKETMYQLPPLEDVVLYRINPRIFASENTFQVITHRLDSIKELGCNILWFMPVYPIGEVKDPSYLAKDYKAVNPEFGTINDFKRLVKEAHKRQLGIILDWTDVADLNYDNADLRQAMINAMKYWIKDSNVDGFCCNAADQVPYDFWVQCIDTLRSVPGKELLMLAGGTRKDHFIAGFDVNYGWDFVEQMQKVYQCGESASSLLQIHMEEYADVPKGKRKMRFITNPDESAKHSPVVEWINERGSMSAFVTVLFFPDVPMIYGSQEVGCRLDWNANPGLRNEYRKLTGIYNQHKALREGDFSFFPDDDILLFKRYNNHESYYILINTRNSSQIMELPDETAEQSFINLLTNRNLSLGSGITLQAFEYLILMKK